jgi:polyferredoxin
MDPVSQAIRGTPADQWFMYGLFYSLAVLVMGWRFVLKYRHNRYQVVRTISVTFFQLIIAFLLPYLLEALNRPSQLAYSTHYFHYFWPLDYDAFWPDTLNAMQGSHGFGSFVMVWSVILAFVAVPVLTYFFGKRWYCSWVCGCGGLAETAGDPFRHLSDKSLRAWRIERVLIHSVLLLITVVTVLLLIQWKWPGVIPMDDGFVGGLKQAYGFVIASTFAGVIGVGFYPIMGSRVWCRFGCPQAAILGILQKWFSRFRITTNGGQCISCGNCSTYCEMGIDVKWYAQRGQNIVRASCVGCGVCSAVCPRGVLRLEGGPIKGKTSNYIDRDELKVLTNG